MRPPLSSPTAVAPEILSGEDHAHWRLAWLSTVDHKRIGVLYLLFSLVFFVLGGVEALLIRVQLAKPLNSFLSPDEFNAMFTMHGTTMIFLVAMPALFGLANYFVPLMIGARDMAFPRLNAFSVWLLPFGGALLYFTVFTGPPAAGWFADAPMSEGAYSSLLGVDYWALALLVLGISSVATGVNLIATMLSLRAPGMTLKRVPLFAWITFVTAFIVIFALPVLNAALAMLLMDRQLGAHFFTAFGGGSPVLWQHLFWAFGHPEVYILALPAFGMISEVVPVFSRKPIFGYEFVAVSSVAIAFLSFGVWAHHMFTVGMGRVADTFFAIASMLIAIPTGVKVLNWSATMVKGKVKLEVPMLYAIAFILQFTCGGLSGVSHAEAALDWQTKNSYYLIAHFHYVAVGGVVFGILAGLHYWFPKMSGRMLDEKLGRITFWFMMLGFNLTFFIQHVLGWEGMPRRVFTYPAFQGWGWMNLMSTCGAFLMAIGSILLVINLWKSFLNGKVAGDNPWNAWTLEWATTSPPPVHNFDSLPPIHSRRPLWDADNPDRPDPVVGQSTMVQPNKLTVGMWALIASEATFFGTLLLVYVFFNVKPDAGPNSLDSLDLFKTGIFSACLFASSFTLWRAERAEEQRKRGRLVFWLGLTILLGLTFMVGQANEYLGLYHRGVVVSTNHFASAFFLVTGFHGFHVCCGLAALMIVFLYFLVFRPKHHLPLRAIGLYWHFVDVVWVFVLGIIYIWPRLK